MDDSILASYNAALFAQQADKAKEFLVSGNILGFQATEDLEDIFADSLAVPVPDDHYAGLVHGGFALAIEELWPEIHLPSGPITIIGHSLGGALATLASIRLHNEGRDVSVYTFGSPRVGDTEFAAKYPCQQLRWVNKTDIVPHVPPDYVHVGTLRYIGLNGKLDGAGPPKICHKIESAIFSVTDHFIESYIAAIKALET